VYYEDEIEIDGRRTMMRAEIEVYKTPHDPNHPTVEIEGEEIKSPLTGQWILLSVLSDDDGIVVTDQEIDKWRERAVDYTLDALV